MAEVLGQRAEDTYVEAMDGDPRTAAIADLREELARTSDQLREAIEDLGDSRRRAAGLSREVLDLQRQNDLLQTELHNLRASVFWRATSPARRFFDRYPRAAVLLRRLAKLVYWTLKGRIFKEARMRLANKSPRPALGEPHPVRCGGMPDRLSAEKETDLLMAALHPPAGVTAASGTEHCPKISLLVPTYNTPARFLLEMIHSVKSQTYPNWQLCIADDGSTDETTKETIRKAAASDERICFVLCEKNSGIAKASMEAAALADGEYVSMLDHDDALAPGALSVVAKAIQSHPEVDMFYTDHAMMSRTGELVSAALKPGWSPEFFLSTNYVVHFKTVRKSLFDSIGGFEGTVDLYTDGGLVLKLMRAGANIRHIPEVQYFWRMHEQSVSDSSARKPGIIDAATGSINRYLALKGVQAQATWAPRLRQTGFGIYKLEFTGQPIKKISVVVPFWPTSRLDDSFFPSFEQTAWPGVKLLFAGIGCSPPRVPENADAVRVDSQDALDAFIRGLDCDAVAFVAPCAIFSSHEWIRELSGYLTVSNDIGAVGGKVLDAYLRTDSAGIRLIEGLPTMSRGMIDTHHGYWFENTIAGNAEAVSCRLLASRKGVVDEVGAPPFFGYGEDAGIPYCLRLRQKGYRCVFNPWAKIITSRPAAHTKDLEFKLQEEFGADYLQDRYYHPQFDLKNA